MTSERQAGKFVHGVHPNLRKRTQLKFSRARMLERCDVLFLCLPHGVSMESVPELRDKAPVIIDLSADFRLNNPADYPTGTATSTPHPDLLGKFVYGIPELHREEIKRRPTSSAGAGCTATAAILGLYPLFRAGVVDLGDADGHRVEDRLVRRAAARAASAATTPSAAA